MECYYRKKKMLGVLAGQILAVFLLIIVALDVAESFFDRIIAWFLAGFCSLAFLATLSWVKKPPPHLLIDENGIHDHRTTISIGWENIDAVGVNDRYLFIEAADPTIVEACLPGWRRYLLRLGRGFNRAIGSSTYMINCLGLNATAEEIYNYIEQVHCWPGKDRDTA